MAKTLRSLRHKRLVAALVEARRSAGVTQAVLAERLKRHQSYVAKYEGGERRLDVVEFIDIVEAIGENPAQIFIKLLSKPEKRGTSRPA